MTLSRRSSQPGGTPDQDLGAPGRLSEEMVLHREGEVGVGWVKEEKEAALGNQRAGTRAWVLKALGVWGRAGQGAGEAMGVRLSFLPTPRGDSASFQQRA